MRSTTSGLAVLITLALGCREREAPRPPPLLVVTVDGATVAELRGTELSSRRSLVDVAPQIGEPASWARLEARTADGRVLHIDEPAARYPGHDLVVHAEDGRATVALYPPVRADQPPHVRAALAAPAAVLTGATTVAISTSEVEPAVEAPARSGLVIVRDGRESTLEAATLDALPQLPGGHKRGGWTLRDVLAAAGVPADAKVTATGREGDQTFDASASGRMRRNRRGELRLELTPEGDAGAGVTLHAVTRLVIEAR